jgi:hypothetical protein
MLNIMGNGLTAANSQPAETKMLSHSHFIAKDYQSAHWTLPPTMPMFGTAAYLALVDLTQTPLTQPDWLSMGRGWRLASAIKALDYMRWPLDSEWVKPNGRARQIKRYRLTQEGMRLALLALEGVVAPC